MTDFAKMAANATDPILDAFIERGAFGVAVEIEKALRSAHAEAEAKGHAAGYAAGQEAMRERAAKMASWLWPQAEGSIRAMPIETGGE